MSRLFLATEASLNRQVVIKLLPPEMDGGTAGPVRKGTYIPYIAPQRGRPLDVRLTRHRLFPSHGNVRCER